MDTTFISIHDLTENATILYSSDSVVDVLGYTPDEIVNTSAWDFFDVADLPYARLYQQKRVALDKAAVLAYVRIRNVAGVWICCECCFTIVYDVMVVCTSIYRQGVRSQLRATEAPMVRRLFASSPKDPRYHMLSHISAKFMASTAMAEHEPRAALFLNRFTRTLTIMYATSGLEEVIGIPGSEMRGRSFYYCIAESCLQDAVKCLENAKGNDSIAYLRFWFRDPRIDDETESSDMSDEEMTSDGSDAEVLQPSRPRVPVLQRAPPSGQSGNTDSDASKAGSSSYSTDAPSSHGMVDSPYFSAGQSPERVRHGEQPEQIELEAVISCTSDGLVVCLRRARALMPFHTGTASQQFGASTGTFAAPWATEPILPTRRSTSSQSIDPSRTDGSSAASSTPAPPEAFMAAIQEQAIFAWALAGINGTLTDFSIGKPRGEAYPADGSPVWANNPNPTTPEKHTVEHWRHPASSSSATVKASDRSTVDGGAGSSAFGDSESEYLNRDLSDAVMRDRNRNLR